MDEAAGCRLSLLTDSRWLGVIVDCFLANATKFCPSGATITVRSWSDGETMRIAVEDTGPGFLSGAVPELFTQYPSIGALPTEGEMSNSLGLFLSTRIAALLGGSVGASSPGLGLGASFWVTLPLHPESSHRGDPN